LPPFDPGVEICAAPVEAETVPVVADGEANAPPTALPPFDPGVEICAALPVEAEAAPVVGAGDVNAPPTALPPFDPGVEIWVWAKAAGAATIRAAAKNKLLVMTFLQTTKGGHDA
jgi:hypothetical protein